MVKVVLLGLCLTSLLGCASDPGGDGGKETAVTEAKGKVNATLSKEEQSSLDAKVKAWDPKKDKKK